MLSKISVFVASGVTSSLFATIFAHFLGGSVKELVACVRVTDDKKKIEYRKSLMEQGVTLLEYKSELPETIQNFFQDVGSPQKNWRILWFSTHDDAKTLAYCAHIAPTLAIGSGAMLDFYTGKIDLAKIDSGTLKYLQGKLRMALTSGVTVLLPGFFLEDNDKVPKTPGGLHHNTTKILIQQAFEKDFKWGKAKYVTPKTMIANIVKKWLIAPESYLDKWYHVGSTKAWQRWELRDHMPEFNDDVSKQIKEDNPASTKRVYLEYANNTVDAFGDIGLCDDEYVFEACKRMKKWSDNNPHQ